MVNIKNKKELSKKVFYAYLCSSSVSDFEDRISLLNDKELPLELNDLGDLRHYYYSYFASDLERKRYDFRHKYVHFKYVSVINQLLILDHNQQINYIVSNKLSASLIKKYCLSYIKFCDNSSDVLSLYNSIDSIYMEISKQKNTSMSEKKYKEAYAIVNDIINSGCFDINYYKKKSSLNSDKINCIFNYFRDNFPADYLIFNNLIMENKKRYFDYYKDKLISFIDFIKSGAKCDIIDYYLMVGMDIDALPYFKDFLGDYDYIFLRDIIGNGINSSFLPTKNTIMQTEYSISGEFISDDCKIMLLNFMDDNNISYYYFSLVLRKYVNGELDKYLNQDSKRLYL